MTDRTLQNFVNGKFVDASDGRTSDVIDPSTGEVYAQAPVSSRQDVDAAMQAAANAFEGWRDSTPSERSLALLRLADAMEKRAGDIVTAETRNTGKPVALTTSEEIPPSVDQIRFFAGAARVLEGRSAGEYMKDHTSMIRREPIGVCAQVTPWNYPMMMAVWKFAPAIPNFQPSEQAYAPAVEVYGLMLEDLRGIGITAPEDADIFTAITGGLVNQQLANDPGGQRWRRLIPRVISMWADDLG